MKPSRHIPYNCLANSAEKFDCIQHTDCFLNPPSDYEPRVFRTTKAVSKDNTLFHSLLVYTDNKLIISPNLVTHSLDRGSVGSPNTPGKIEKIIFGMIRCQSAITDTQCIRRVWCPTWDAEHNWSMLFQRVSFLFADWCIWNSCLDVLISINCISQINAPDSPYIFCRRDVRF